MNFNNANNMFNINNNIIIINQQPNFFNNNIPLDFSPFGSPQNLMIQESFYDVQFSTAKGNKFNYKFLADNSIKDILQIFLKIKSIDPEDVCFLCNARKLDINSQKKIKDLASNNSNVIIITVIEINNPHIKINFNTSSGIKTMVKFSGCLCCSSFWELLKNYIHNIGLYESDLKNLKFIFNSKILPNDKTEAMKNSSAKYGIGPDSTILVIDT